MRWCESCTIGDYVSGVFRVGEVVVVYAPRLCLNATIATSEDAWDAESADDRARCGANIAPEDALDKREHNRSRTRRHKACCEE